MNCRSCGHTHLELESCVYPVVPFYFHARNFPNPQTFDWKNGVFEDLVTPCGDQSEVDLMKAFVQHQRITRWYVGEKAPRSAGIDLVDGGLLIYVYRLDLQRLEDAYTWWEAKGSR